MSASVWIMAGGTGGHIYPAMALAQALRERGWRVQWLGGPAPSMESRLVPEAGFEMLTLSMGGVRGKGLGTWLRLPLNLMRALWQSLSLLRRHRPALLVGFGGYITFATGALAALTGRPLFLHEQNAIAGTANRWLAPLARRCFTAFPKVLAKGEWIGNPLRTALLAVPEPAQRYGQRQGPLRVLVVGGSLGAQALNALVPQALALMPADQRPHVIHQTGDKHWEQAQANYQQAGVAVDLRAYIPDMATELAQADLVIARSGASTVTEVAAVGVAAAFVPFPHAIDDHQTANARFLSDAGAALLLPQHSLSPQGLAELLTQHTREDLLDRAQRARALGQREATQQLLQACEEVLA